MPLCGTEKHRHNEDVKADAGDAYQYLIKQFADDAGKKGGEFYTPGGGGAVDGRVRAVRGRR
ncbi:MAG: N-6 DNA methylase [Bryobacterales bacterium]|nr:N-6 DNA methylase [Bryobacterales bacterium]